MRSPHDTSHRISVVRWFTMTALSCRPKAAQLQKASISLSLFHSLVHICIDFMINSITAMFVNLAQSPDIDRCSHTKNSIFCIITLLQESGIHAYLFSGKGDAFYERTAFYVRKTRTSRIGPSEAESTRYSTGFSPLNITLFENM